MKYDFVTVPNRHTMSSTKWSSMRAANPAVPDDIVPFGMADMDFVHPPQITEGLKAYIDGIVFGYTRPGDKYLDAVAGWMERRHNWHIEREWILSSPGIVPALYDAVSAFTNPGEGVILFTPVYFPFYGAVRTGGRDIVECPLVPADDSYVIDFDAFEKLAKEEKNTLLIFCSPHNPLGRVWRRDELEKLAAICLENHVTVICDEIHHDLIMPGYEHTVFASLSPRVAEITVTCTAASKSFNLAGLSTASLIISNPSLRKAFSDAMGGHGIHGGNMMGYKAAEIAYTQCEDWLDELITVIKGNYDYVSNFCKEQLPEIAVTRLEGTYLLWLDMRAFGLSESELKEKLTTEALFFGNMGAAFGSAGEGFVRMALACPHSVVAAAMERIAAWAKTVRK